MSYRVIVTIIGVLTLAVGSAQAATFYETGFEQSDAVGPFNLSDLTGQGTPAWANSFFGGGGGQTENSGEVVDTQVFDGSQSLHLFSNNIEQSETSHVAFTSGTQSQWIEFAFRIEDTFAGKNANFRHLAGSGEPGSPQGLYVEFQSTGNNIVANGTTIGQFTEDQWHTISFEMEKSPSYTGNYNVYLDGIFADSSSFFAGGGADFLRGLVFSARNGEFTPGNNWFVDGIHIGDEQKYIPEPASLALLSIGGLLILCRR